MLGQLSCPRIVLSVLPLFNRPHQPNPEAYRKPRAAFHGVSNVRRAGRWSRINVNYQSFMTDRRDLAKIRETAFFQFLINRSAVRGRVWAPFIFRPKSSVSPNLSVVFQSLDDAYGVHSADGFTVFGYVNARVRARQLFNQIGNWGFGIDRF